MPTLKANDAFGALRSTEEPNQSQPLFPPAVGLAAMVWGHGGWKNSTAARAKTKPNKKHEIRILFSKGNYYFLEKIVLPHVHCFRTYIH